MKKAYHVSNKTITFNTNKSNLLNFLENIDYIEIDNSKKDIRNIKKSIFNLSVESEKINNTCFVYMMDLNKLLVKENTVFDNIRLWAEERGIYEKGNTHTQYVKLQEEAGELAKALLKNDMPEIQDAIGDTVVVLTNLSHQLGLKIEDCIDSAYNVISSRTGKMINGTFVKDNE